MTEPMRPEDDTELSAAELALGLIEGADRAVALRRQLEDPAFRARVDDWRGLALGWTEELVPAELDELAWQRIATALGGGTADGLAAPAAMPVPSDIHRQASSRWRWTALASSATAALLAMALAVTLVSRPGATSLPAKPTPPLAVAPPEPNVAQIAGDRGAPPLVSAAYYPRDGRLLLRVADFAKPDKAPELWVLDKAGKPHSLGLIDQGSSVTISISDTLKALLTDGATMAITLEDRAGAPHPAPRGKILGTATLSTL